MESITDLEKYLHDLQKSLLNGERVEPLILVGHMNQLVRAVRLEARAKALLSDELREQLSQIRFNEIEDDIIPFPTDGKFFIKKRF